MVVYAGSSGILLELTPGTETDSIKQAISRLEAGGSTVDTMGIRLALAPDSSLWSRIPVG